MHAITVLQPTKHVTKQKTKSYRQHVCNGKRAAHTDIDTGLTDVIRQYTVTSQTWTHVFHSLKQIHLISTSTSNTSRTSWSKLTWQTASEFRRMHLGHRAVYQAIGMSDSCCSLWIIGLLLVRQSRSLMRHQSHLLSFSFSFTVAICNDIF